MQHAGLNGGFCRLSNSRPVVKKNLDAKGKESWAPMSRRDVGRVTMLRMNPRSVSLGAASIVALSIGLPEQGRAQSSLPPVTVDAPQQQAVRAVKPKRNAARSTRSSRRAAAPAQRQAVTPQDNARASAERGTGPVTGYLAHQSISSTKTDTPILETPQSISVITRETSTRASPWFWASLIWDSTHSWLLMPGGLWFGIHAVPLLEAEFGRPVLLNILSTTWAALRAAGDRMLHRPDPHWGKVLASV